MRVVQYRKADREDVFAFLRTVYSSSRSERLIAQWEWKYDANPFNRFPEPYIILLKHGERIAGMFGGFPVRFVIGGNQRWVSHGGDWIVHPDYRDRRLSRLVWWPHQHYSPLRFSWQNEFSFQKGTRELGPDRARLVPLVKPIDATSILRSATRIGRLGGAGAPLLGGAVSLLNTWRQRSRVPGIDVHRIEHFDERFDALWRRTCWHYPVMVVRDARYLNWRFCDRPDVTYTVLVAARGPDIAGYLVVRSAEKDEGRWGYLVDFLVEDKSPAIFSLLVEAGLSHLRREGVTAVSCRAVVPPYRVPLYRHGFLPLRWGPRGYLCAYVPFSHPDYPLFHDVRRWFVTMGDGDLELDF